MKRIITSPQFIIIGCIVLICSLIFAVNPNARAQEKPKQDSIQAYQFTVQPKNLNAAIKILQEKFLKNGSLSDTVLLNNALQLMLSNGKAVKISNPESEKKLINPKSK